MSATNAMGNIRITLDAAKIKLIRDYNTQLKGEKSRCCFDFFFSAHAKTKEAKRQLTTGFLQKKVGEQFVEVQEGDELILSNSDLSKLTRAEAWFRWDDSSSRGFQLAKKLGCFSIDESFLKNYSPALQGKTATSNSSSDLPTEQKYEAEIRMLNTDQLKNIVNSIFEKEAFYRNKTISLFDTLQVKKLDDPNTWTNDGIYEEVRNLLINFLQKRSTQSEAESTLHFTVSSQVNKYVNAKIPKIQFVEPKITKSENFSDSKNKVSLPESLFLVSKMERDVVSYSDEELVDEIDSDKLKKIMTYFLIDNKYFLECALVKAKIIEIGNKLIAGDIVQAKLILKNFLKEDLKFAEVQENKLKYKQFQLKMRSELTNIMRK